MFRGDPNTSSQPYAPTSYDRTPFQPGAQNPYGYGYQRVAGQIAPQVSYRPFHQLNTAPQAQVPNTYFRPNYPNSVGLGQRITPPSPVIINDPYTMNPNYAQHPQNPMPAWGAGGQNFYAPEPMLPTDMFRRLGY